jgi:hypothetical protein
MRTTPYDTGARYEAKVWQPERWDEDTYGKVDFEDDAGQTALTVYAGRVNGVLELHVYSHGGQSYAIDIDDRDFRFEVPEETGIEDI